MEKNRTVREVAEILRLHENAVYQMIQEGKLKAVRVGPRGGKILIPQSAIDRFLGKEE